jgi:hypothetical protein
VFEFAEGAEEVALGGIDDSLEQPHGVGPGGERAAGIDLGRRAGMRAAHGVSPEAGFGGPQPAQRRVVGDEEPDQRTLDAGGRAVLLHVLIGQEHETVIVLAGTD